MTSNFNQQNYEKYNDDDFSIGTEGSNEPYYHTSTGKIYPAREAWSILAAEGHPHYISKLSGNNSSTQSTSRKQVFRNNNNDVHHPESLIEDDSEGSSIHQVSSFSGPTQSQIDSALHPGQLCLSLCAYHNVFIIYILQWENSISLFSTIYILTTNNRIT